MVRNGVTPEKIIGLLRQAEIELAKSQTVGKICRGFGISEASYHRWRAEYGEQKLGQARRLKELEKENGRLRKAVAELALDKLILNEAAEGNFQAPSVAGWGATCAFGARGIQAAGVPHAGPGPLHPAPPANTTSRCGAADRGGDAVGRRVRLLRLPADHGAAACRWLASVQR
jgi:transposase-like protein